VSSIAILIESIAIFFPSDSLRRGASVSLVAFGPSPKKFRAEEYVVEMCTDGAPSRRWPMGVAHGRLWPKPALTKEL
jgi:hypothetical protein